MLQAMLSGVSGLQAQQTKLNVIGNNVANVNTVAYKAGRVSFTDQLSQTIKSATAVSGNMGGTDATQVGMGVTVGSVDTITTQGDLQSTGNTSDLAIQGNGYFLVSNGNAMVYTRNGNFTLDSTGALVNSSTGNRLIGYKADGNGNIDASTPISAATSLAIPLNALSNAKQSATLSLTGNLDASSAVYSTNVTYGGNLASNAAATDTVSQKSTVYDSLGNAHTVEMLFTNPTTNPTGASVPTGATQSWDVQVRVDNTAIYDSTSGKSKIYNVGGTWEFADATGTSLGSSIQLNGGSAMNTGSKITGTNGADDLSLNLNCGSLTNTTSATSLAGVPDGQTGDTPYGGATVTAYDSLGVAHTISFKFTRVPLDANAPTNATSRWDWTASENGTVLSSSATSGNTPFYFGTDGKWIIGSAQTVTISPTTGATTPFTVQLDASNLTQLASDYNMSTSQDGYGVGTLSDYTIGKDGTITGVFSNGQSRTLGQIAMATFANPNGLEKIGGNCYTESLNSGTAQIGVPNQAGRGSIASGSLESSNVDLSSEFTDLIVAQRAFQSNSKVITVADTLTQDVINLLR